MKAKEDLNKEERFQPPRHTKPEDIPDTLESQGGGMIIDVKPVKESIAWMIDMNEYIKEKKITCEVCDDFPCFRYPYKDSKAGFCFKPIKK